MISKEQSKQIEEARRILSEQKLTETFSDKEENLKRVEKLKKILENEQKSGTTEQLKV